jgi:hypothetical protein
MQQAARAAVSANEQLDAHLLACMPALGIFCMAHVAERAPCLLCGRRKVDHVFGGCNSVEEIYAACEEKGGQWGVETVAEMAK